MKYTKKTEAKKTELKKINIKPEEFKTMKISTNQANETVKLMQGKTEIMSLPLMYNPPTETFKKNVKSAMLWVNNNIETYNELFKAVTASPAEVIHLLETEASNYANPIIEQVAEAKKAGVTAEVELKNVQAFRLDTFIYQYSICLLFGISQGKIDKIKKSNGTSVTKAKLINDAGGKAKTKTIVSDDSIKAIDIKAKKSQAKRKTATSHKSGACVVVVPAKALAKA